MLKGKTVVLGVSGSIAAYKAASLASLLVKSGANVEVVMTKNATNIINPITFENLTGNRCMVDTFDRNFQFKVEHISLAKRADIFVIAPATANVIAKVANGLADDMLTTTFLACTCPKYIFPAMNTGMYENPITQDNIKKCRSFGISVVEPASGHLACGDVGKGKMLESDIIFEYIELCLAYEKDLKGLSVLVTAGPTREKIDPVRFISNHSTGKMGYTLARVAAARGANVTLVSGPVSLKPPVGVEVVNVESAAQMAQAVKERFEKQDIVIKAAAVADYRCVEIADQKIKKHDGNMELKLERTEDILAYLGAHKKSNQFICGFSMETQNLIENSKEKLKKKNVDMIVANSIAQQGAGFGVDTNIVSIITKDNVVDYPLLSKEEVAVNILNEIKNEFKRD